MSGGVICPEVKKMNQEDDDKSPFCSAVNFNFEALKQSTVVNYEFGHSYKNIFRTEAKEIIFLPHIINTTKRLMRPKLLNSFFGLSSDGWRKRGKEPIIKALLRRK